MLALPFLALGWYLAALVVILLNRLLDGLDGALARRRGLTDAGGFLDISLDFLFFLRAGTFWVYPRRTAAKRPGRRLAAVCVYRHRQQFSRFCCAGGETSD
ncbi:CDP-alcohol phosphatidyltransferase family protein [Escherichia coli]